ncbi:MAG: hypothetical protein ACI4DY_08740 [Monoglobaceae bacterium]
MKRAKMILTRLLYPPKWILISVPGVVFAALIFIFAAEKTESMSAYPIYCMSAYSLSILLAAAPMTVRKLKFAVTNSRIMRKAASSHLCGKYLNDIAFRGGVGIYRGMTINFLYVIFRVAAGIRYHSVWSISMAVYYLVLGGLRAYLLFNYRHRNAKSEFHCYHMTAWMLFLLNIPMGGMIILMIRTNSGFSYPGYIIYLSALYTFYAMIMSIVNIIKFRKLGSPVLSAAKVLNFVSAMMSILGLQTAMISRFSADGENYRKMMNTITGGFVWGIVIMIAIYMLICSAKRRKKAEYLE